MTGQCKAFLDHCVVFRRNGWLGEQGAARIIAGGMGQRARQLFLQQGIEVTVGAPAETPEILAQAYLEGTLDTGENLCDH